MHIAIKVKMQMIVNLIKIKRKFSNYKSFHLKTIFNNSKDREEGKVLRIKVVIKYHFSRQIMYKA